MARSFLAARSRRRRRRAPPNGLSEKSPARRGTRRRTFRDILSRCPAPIGVLLSAGLALPLLLLKVSVVSGNQGPGDFGDGGCDHKGSANGRGNRPSTRHFIDFGS